MVHRGDPAELWPRISSEDSPGLITCIYDKDRDHVFTLQGFEHAPLGEVIYRKKKSYFKTTRERLQQAIRNYMANPLGLQHTEDQRPGEEDRQAT